MNALQDKTTTSLIVLENLSPPPPREVSQVSYLVQLKGETYGPYPFSQIKKMWVRGELDDSCSFRKERSLDPWESLSRLALWLGEVDEAAFHRSARPEAGGENFRTERRRTARKAS